MTASPLNGATISHYRVLKPLGAGGMAAVVLVSAAVALRLYKLGILSGADSAVTFSPDGKRFAFLRSSGTKESALIVVSPDGTGEQKLSSPNAPDTTS